jgi:hypothetical protein
LIDDMPDLAANVEGLGAQRRQAESFLEKLRNKSYKPDYDYLAL